ncbi:MAG: hypothetical protein KDB02_02755 [Acidimicrobiales bacterium]|nr:hypothetical protein [Acidimicrobiales bacterium]
MSRRPAGFWILLSVLGLLAASCSGGGGDPSATEASSTTSSHDSSAGGPTTTTPDTGNSPNVTVTDRIRIEVLSSQPDRVTGDEARIRVTPKSGGDVEDLRVMVDGRDVTASLTPGTDGNAGSIEGVVSGLHEGTNSVTASSGTDRSTLRLRAWPRQGPMISGPQTPLFACATEEFGLGPGAAGTCAAPSKVSWKAVTADSRIVDVADPTAPEPPGTVDAKVDGANVPAMVRVERGVLNRSTYELAVLDRAPGRPDADLDAAWNRRLVVRFDDGCGAGHVQGEPGSSAVDPALLLKGYAVVTAGFTTGAVSCNDVVASETVMMLKERVVELLGEVDLTIGDGTGFGGAMAHLILQDYPTLLDGVTTLDAVPDTVTTANQVADCLLLKRYFASARGSRLDERRRAAISGHETTGTCARIAERYGTMFDPVTGCDPQVPREKVFDADRRPGGVRCTFQDLNAVSFGVDHSTGFAHRPVDNTGLQYGLDALNHGTISVDEFLDLNEHIGGLDLDGQPKPERSAVDPNALQTMYENGRIAEGVGDMRKVPLIDIVSSPESDRIGDLHQALAMRDRLTRGGSPEVAPGHQIWLLPKAAPGADRRAASNRAIGLIDTWLTAMRADGSDPQSLLTERPDAAVSQCGSAGADRGAAVFDDPAGKCLGMNRPLGDARIVAGGPLTGDVVKCQLTVLDSDDYQVSFSSSQWERLTRIFPDGVCDWTSAGAGQTLPTMPDRSFADVEVPADLA